MRLQNDDEGEVWKGSDTALGDISNVEEIKVIYVGSVAGPLMGAGYYYLLEKTERRVGNPKSKHGLDLLKAPQRLP